VAIPITSGRRRLAPARLALHAEAVCAVVLASLAIRLLPFPRVVALGSRPKRVHGESADVAALRGPVRGWASRVPWRALCFETAVALRMMLARRGIASTLHYGIASEDVLKAHVWLSLGQTVVVGGDGAADYTEVATFPPGRPR
jgi:hypothetical protein